VLGMFYLSCVDTKSFKGFDTHLPTSVYIHMSGLAVNCVRPLCHAQTSTAHHRIGHPAHTDGTTTPAFHRASCRAASSGGSPSTCTPRHSHYHAGATVEHTDA